MLDSNLESFSNNLYRYITGQAKTGRNLLVKRHTENLQKYGDYSFPNTLKSWHDVLESNEITSQADLSLLRRINKKPEDFVGDSKKWNLPIKSVQEVKDRVHLFLERPRAIHVGLKEAGQNNVLICERINRGTSLATIDPLCTEQSSITSLRLKHFAKTVHNLCAVCLDNETRTILLTYKSSSRCKVKRVLLCGTVLNAKTGSKETVISAEEFKRLRQNEMTLIAQHKYGIRVTTESNWKEFIGHLGESAVVFEMLQIKPSCAVKINLDNSAGGCSKGAAFILYNCARLETIIKTYNEKVAEGTYPPLPDFDKVDWSLLTDEDEWCLVFNYILGLPPLLSSCVEYNDSACEFRPHLICSFLCSMVRVFSQYYRRVRILTEPRQHLLPVLFARLSMLKVLNDTLKSCLKILNIKSVSQM